LTKKDKRGVKKTICTKKNSFLIFQQNKLHANDVNDENKKETINNKNKTEKKYLLAQTEAKKWLKITTL